MANERWSEGGAARLVGAGALVLALLVGAGLPVEAQAEAGASGSLRPFWHVFIAYALAWLILLGWLVSIARRLGRVEDRLEEEGNAPTSGAG